MINQSHNHPVPVFCLLVTIGMALLSACEQSNIPSITQTQNSTSLPSSTQTQAGRATSHPSDTSPASTQEVQTDQITITYAAYMDPPYPEKRMILQPLADEFHQKNPTITIHLINLFDVPSKDMENNWAKVADTFEMAGNPAYGRGYLNLQPLMDASSDFNLHDFIPEVTSACSDLDGIPYGVPLAYSAIGIYYDPKVFDQLGQPYPQPGWTWDQFELLISKVSRFTPEGKQIYGFVDGMGTSILSPGLYDQLQATNGKLDSKAIAASVSWYLQLAKQQKLWPHQSSTFDPSTGNYLWEPLQEQGQAAMWLDSLDKTNGMVGADKKEGVFMPFPVDPANDHTTPGIVTCGAISAGTQNPQAAWAWLDFLSQHDLTGSGTAHQIPTRKDLLATSPFWQSLADADRTTIQYALDHAWYPSSDQGYTPWEILNAIIDSISSGANLTAALEEIPSTTEGTQATPTLAPFVVNTPALTPAGNQQVITFNVSYEINGLYSINTLNDFIADFERQHPHIQVKLTTGFSIPEDGYAFRGMGKTADCFTFPRPDLFDQPLSDADLLDLTPFLDTAAALKSEIPAAFWRPYQQGGKTYGLPSDVGVELIAYNQDLLTQLGIPLPSQGWTFDEMLTLAAQVVAASPDSSVYGLAANNDLLLDAEGVRWYDNTPQPPQALFTSSDVAKGLAWLEQLYQKRTWLPEYAAMLPANQKPVNYPGFEQAIANGQVAMWMTDGLREDDRNLDFKVGYVPLPVLTSGSSLAYIANSQGYFISSQAKYPQACWAWIQYLSDQPGLFGGYSTRLSILEASFAGKNQAKLSAIQAAIRAYREDTSFINPLLFPYRNEWGKAETAILQGKDIPQVLAEAQRKAEVYRACISQKDLTGLDPVQQEKLAQACYNTNAP